MDVQPISRVIGSFNRDYSESRELNKKIYLSRLRWANKSFGAIVRSVCECVEVEIGSRNNLPVSGGFETVGRGLHRQNALKTLQIVSGATVLPCHSAASAGVEEDGCSASSSGLGSIFGVWLELRFGFRGISTQSWPKLAGGAGNDAKRSSATILLTFQTPTSKHQSLLIEITSSSSKGQTLSLVEAQAEFVGS